MSAGQAPSQPSPAAPAGPPTRPERRSRINGAARTGAGEYPRTPESADERLGGIDELRARLAEIAERDRATGRVELERGMSDSQRRAIKRARAER